jgi:hypothetical protein
VSAVSACTPGHIADREWWTTTIELNGWMNESPLAMQRQLSKNTPAHGVTVWTKTSQPAAQQLARKAVPTTRECITIYDTLYDTHIFALILARVPQPKPIEELTAVYEIKREAFNQDGALARELATNPLGPLNAEETPADLAALTVVANILLNLDGVLTRNWAERQTGHISRLRTTSASTHAPVWCLVTPRTACERPLRPTTVSGADRAAACEGDATQTVGLGWLNEPDRLASENVDLTRAAANGSDPPCSMSVCPWSTRTNPPWRGSLP